MFHRNDSIPFERGIRMRKSHITPKQNETNNQNIPPIQILFPRIHKRPEISFFFFMTKKISHSLFPKKQKEKEKKRQHEFDLEAKNRTLKIDRVLLICILIVFS